MRGDIYEILTKLGFENDSIDRSFRVIRDDIAVSLSTISLSISDTRAAMWKIGARPTSTTSIFLIEKITKDHSLEETSNDIITEVFINIIDYDLIRSHILRFFQSDIREKSLTYLLDR